MKKNILFLIIVFILLFYGLSLGDSDKFYEPLNGKELKPIVFVKQCEENRFVLGLDENNNKLIDACYSIKYIDGRLNQKRVKIFYNISDEKVVIKQGCVCD